MLGVYGCRCFADTLFLFEVGKAAFLLPKFERLPI